MHDYYEQLPSGVTIVPGKTGAFEVIYGDQRLFSKLESERFPEENEVEQKFGDVVGVA